ncbi:23S rRNA (uracil(1939)-C(5))-methyltransferase RlmD [Pseudoalteromonas sp. BDTF-M6]|uniref:23S rRNA (uracil(1939)-C(5))-methyltransferase RlmD n=1 Tax=Pseudoalteromonas sp. BDTF-M6 TaxID=2796132 RepID=UPI001BAEB460|nr:23S rRNA (uracil(1939)-C(5))-methyltransferase RlmD [Pseudoalteromonas sp. BDTF-M6]MBS3799074.1 23S rRNA (uracil(1939)-C(5))-methyltransferase RlmD [Pseudoalteromonas sp. BDTF-M6]
MANFFKPSKKQVKNQTQELSIQSMDHHGRGVAKSNGKVVFVNGSLTGERVLARISADKKSYAEAQCIKVLEPSAARVTPPCQHYQQCGGCNLQHLELQAQLDAKQQAVGALFAKFTGQSELPWQRSIESQPWHYRRSARISIFHDKNRGLQVGFRQQGSKQIVNIEHCPVLEQGFAEVFAFFRAQINQHPALRSLSHLQLVATDEKHYLVIRHTKAIADKVQQLVADAAKEHDWSLVWQHSAEQRLPAASYQIKQGDLSLQFGLDNFIQVNAEVNEQMLTQAMQWLNLGADEQVLDLFCGVGNFSLLAAQQAKRVVGVEGVASAVDYAQLNAQANALDNCQFHCFDLTEPLAQASWFDKNLDVLLLDPSRMGAEAILAQLPLKQFKRVLYVSCDPVTLARDSKTILAAGFTLNKLGIMNMFPHTGHIETMALFTRG